MTPNPVHYEAEKKFLRREFNVICYKPLTSNLLYTEKLKKRAEMLQNGDLEKIRVVQVEYAQD